MSFRVALFGFLNVTILCCAVQPTPDGGSGGGKFGAGGGAPAGGQAGGGFAGGEGVGGGSERPCEFDAGRADAGVGPVVILMIGDGMGPGQLEAASLYAHGRPGALFMQSLPHRGSVSTASLSGITDSAAAATTMATGKRTYNGNVGLDRFDQPAETLVEWAKARGMRTGVVSTSSLPHATPGSFSAHRTERGDYLDIANDQALVVRPDVMLGGGGWFYLPAGPDSRRTDQGLLAPLADAGYQVVQTAAQLSCVPSTPTSKVVGVFAPEHLDYVKDRIPGTTQPTLDQMAMAAIRVLDTGSQGFFLMIEGARIDMASHLNDLERTVGETIAFDTTIAAVTAWARARGNATVIVTADHECGGLTVTRPEGKGVLPQVEWRWLQHTNAHVSVFGDGPGTAAFHEKLVDHAWLHALMLSQLSKAPFAPPPTVLVPDGRMVDLRHRAVLQANESGYGVGINQLDALWLDADENGLAIGVEGLFEWGRNAVVVLIDADFGAATGSTRFKGVLGDTMGQADSIIASLSLDARSIPGFGAELALVSHGGVESRSEDLLDAAGLRAIAPPLGGGTDFAWLSTSLNFGAGVRTRTISAPVPGEGLEAFIPWTRLYPSLNGRVPKGVTVAVAVVLVNDDGGHSSNQMLPPFDAGMTNPGRVLTPFPGVVRFQVDADNDGVADGRNAPTTLGPPPRN
jgi:alkaline phosphatase